MSKDMTTYGLVINGQFFSNRMEFRTRMPNGIYALDMECDDFKNSMEPADIDSAIRFFRKKSKVKVFRGISFHDGIIPENPVAFPTIPVRVLDASFDAFEEVEVATPLNGTCYFLRIVSTDKAFALMDLRDAFENQTGIDQITGLTPEMRIVFTFHVLERQREEEERRREELRLMKLAESERRKAELLIPSNAIKAALESSGATVISIKPVKRGFETVWESHGHTINSLLDRNYRVIEAGFCVSGWDKTQSVGSVARVLDRYVDDGDYIYKTRN